MTLSQNYKVIVVGESSTGKTTIIQRLVQGTFREEAQSTVGVEFKSFVCTVDGKQRKLQIWDTAGQERFRAVAKSYFRNAVGAFLVFDVCSRGSFDALTEWLNDIQSLSHPNSVIVLIGNKIDLVDQRCVSQSEAQSYADRNNLIYIETSARSGVGIADAFIRITREITLRIEAGQLSLPTLKSQPQMMYTNSNGLSGSNVSNATIRDQQQCGC